MLESAVYAKKGVVQKTGSTSRIAAARERVEAEGKKWGRPSRLSEATRLRIAELRGEGRSYRDIAVALKVPLATVARAARACRKDGG
jgi:hypothetical protein